MALITCQDAAFGYDGHIVVEGLNFQVNAGDYLCIVGENGSGKTTLLQGLLRLKQPAAGRVITGDGLKASHIGYLPQQTAVQKDFPASVAEVVLSGRLNSLGLKSFYCKKDRDVAKKNMERLGITELWGHCYRELSVGQQQRVLLARALCAAKRLLLLDEPVSGLDPLASKEFYTLVEKINKELGMTVVMVSHDVKSAVKQAGYILHLNASQVFFGTAKDYAGSEPGLAFLGGIDNV